MLLKTSQSNVIVVFPHFAHIMVLTKCPHDYLTKDFDPFLELFFLLLGEVIYSIYYDARD